jgi:mono/diheme cytochrome c family protein
MPYEAMVLQLRTPRYEMPPYVESQVSDKSIADIHAYLKSVPRPVDPSVIKAMQ